MTSKMLVFSCEIGQSSWSALVSMSFLMAVVVIRCFGYLILQKTSLFGHILRGNITAEDNRFDRSSIMLMKLCTRLVLVGLILILHSS